MSVSLCGCRVFTCSPLQASEARAAILFQYQQSCLPPARSKRKRGGLCRVRSGPCLRPPEDPGTPPRAFCSLKDMFPAAQEARWWGCLPETCPSCLSAGQPPEDSSGRCQVLTPDYSAKLAGGDHDKEMTMKT